MTKDRVHFKQVLDNGIRIVGERIPDVKSVSLGVWVGVGSRDEEERLAGISHFIEHMFFKGTRRRSAGRIAREMDGLGGELNAFTSRENTTFYFKVLDEHLSRAVDLIGDIIRHSQFESADIEKERDVILQEIKMSEDDPEDLVHELHTQNLWKGDPLGRSILGRVKTVGGINRREILSFVKHAYRPERTVIAVAGNFSPTRLVGHLNRVFGPMKPHSSWISRRVPPTANGRFLLKKKNLKQVHICLGMAGVPLVHKDRYAMVVLNALLGGGMSSRLFQEIRERRGLVYSIYSHFSGFQDAGLFTIYAATNEEEMNRLLKLTLRELARLRKGGITRSELNRTVTQIKGNIMLGLESTDSRMARLAKDEIYFGRFFSLKETLHRIEKVSLRQIRQLCEEAFDPSRLSLTVLGPVDSVNRPIRAIFN